MVVMAEMATALRLAAALANTKLMTAKAVDGEAALVAMDDYRPSVVAVDLHLGGTLPAVDLIRELRRRPEPPEVVAVTVAGPLSDPDAGPDAGPDADLADPGDDPGDDPGSYLILHGYEVPVIPVPVLATHPRVVEAPKALVAAVRSKADETHTDAVAITAATDPDSDPGPDPDPDTARLLRPRS